MAGGLIREDAIREIRERASITEIVSDVVTSAPALTDKQSAIWILVLLSIEWIQRDYENPLRLDRFPRPVRWGLYYGFATTIFMFAPIHYTPFIYFQF